MTLEECIDIRKCKICKKLKACKCILTKLNLFKKEI